LQVAACQIEHAHLLAIADDTRLLKVVGQLVAQFADRFGGEVAAAWETGQQLPLVPVDGPGALAQLEDSTPAGEA
jgi:hypothetical protein